MRVGRRLGTVCHLRSSRARSYVLALTASLAPFAYLYPDIWLRERTKKRQAQFEKEFPFFLDVIVLGMKAGLAFTAALEQAIGQLGAGPVKRAFERCLRETRTGVGRARSPCGPNSHTRGDQLRRLRHTDRGNRSYACRRAGRPAKDSDGGNASCGLRSSRIRRQSKC